VKWSWPVQIGQLKLQVQQHSESSASESNGKSCESNIIDVENGEKQSSYFTTATNSTNTPAFAEGEETTKHDVIVDHPHVLSPQKNTTTSPSKVEPKSPTPQSFPMPDMLLPNPPSLPQRNQLIAWNPTGVKACVTVIVDGKVSGKSNIGGKTDQDSTKSKSEIFVAAMKVHKMYAVEFNSFIIDLNSASKEVIEETYQLFKKADMLCLSEKSRVALTRSQGGQNTCVPIVMYLSVIACFTKEGLVVSNNYEDAYFKKISKKAIKKSGGGLHQVLDQVGADVELGHQLVHIFAEACGASFPTKVGDPKLVFSLSAIDVMFREFSGNHDRTHALMIVHAYHAYAMLKFPMNDAIYCIDTLTLPNRPAYYQKFDTLEEAKTHFILKAMKSVHTFSNVEGWHEQNSKNNSVTLQQFVYFIIKSPSPIDRITTKALDGVINEHVRRKTKKCLRSRSKGNKVSGGKYTNISFDCNATIRPLI